MAEPPPNLTDDEEAGGLTDSDVENAGETSDYGTEEQEHVSDPSGGEGSDGSDNDSEEEDGDGEEGEIMEDVYACADSEVMREEGNALFKKKKVRRLSLIGPTPIIRQYFQYNEAAVKYKTAAAIGEGCKVGLDSGWQGLIKAYWLVS